MYTFTFLNIYIYICYSSMYHNIISIKVYLHYIFISINDLWFIYLSIRPCHCSMKNSKMIFISTDTEWYRNSWKDRHLVFLLKVSFLRVWRCCPLQGGWGGCHNYVPVKTFDTGTVSKGLYPWNWLDRHWETNATQPPVTTTISHHSRTPGNYIIAQPVCKPTCCSSNPL